MEVGGTATAIGSVITLNAGFGLGLLGDERAGMEAVLDVVIGRALRNVPDALTPYTDAEVDAGIDAVIDWRRPDLPDCDG